MAPTSEAEEHLRVIRSLMERATIYRAISTQAALLGGLFACIAGFVLAGTRDPFVNSLARQASQAPNAELVGFQLKWLVILALSGAANFYFLYRKAGQRGEAFVSPGMRTALRAMLPPLLCGAVFTSMLGRDALPQVWMLFYGLALLSTAHFAPTSLVRLGWAFLLAGMATILVNGEVLLGLSEQSAVPLPGARTQHGYTFPDLLMAGTFGLFHLVYAACTFRLGSRPEPTSAA